MTEDIKQPDSGSQAASEVIANEIQNETLKPRIKETVARKLIDTIQDKIDAPPLPIVHWYQKAWVLLNGKKRDIGILTLAAGYIVGSATPVGIVLQLIGGLFAGVGVVHDIGKQSDVGAPGVFGWKEVLQMILDWLTKNFAKEKAV